MPDEWCHQWANESVSWWLIMLHKALSLDWLSTIWSDTCQRNAWSVKAGIISFGQILRATQHGDCSALITCIRLRYSSAPLQAVHAQHVKCALCFSSQLDWIGWQNHWLSSDSHVCTNPSHEEKIDPIISAHRAGSVLLTAVNGNAVTDCCRRNVVTGSDYRVKLLLWFYSIRSGSAALPPTQPCTSKWALVVTEPIPWHTKCSFWLEEDST